MTGIELHAWCKALGFCWDGVSLAAAQHALLHEQATRKQALQQVHSCCCSL